MASGIKFALAFCMLLSIAVWMDSLPSWMMTVYLALSALTFILYALDKSAARNRRWRTSESTLHLCALCGGWPGALFAQNLLRHKSSKRQFRLVFWLTVLINCLILGWLLTPHGRDLLHALAS